MNKGYCETLRFLAFTVALLAGISLATGAFAQGRKNASGEQFFIVSSVDLQKSQLLLKHPTEVTLVVKTNDATRFADGTGKPLREVTPCRSRFCP